MPHTEIKHQDGIGGAAYDRGKSFLKAAQLIIDNLPQEQIDAINNAKNFPLKQVLPNQQPPKSNFELLQIYLQALRTNWKDQKENKHDLKPEDLALLERTLVDTIRENVYVPEPEKAKKGKSKQKSFKKVKDELDNAENHINWIERQTKDCVEVKNDGIAISRNEEPISRFTKELTAEWEQITNPNPHARPAWFKALAPWEQNYFNTKLDAWLRKEYPKPNLGDFLGPVPTTIRRYPGAPNAYITKVTIQSDDKEKAPQKFVKIRSGVIAPPKMKGKDQVAVAKMNLEQLVAVAVQVKIDELKDRNPKPTFSDLPVLFQTLYSPPLQPEGKSNEAVMAAYKQLQKELERNPEAFLKKHNIYTHDIKINAVDLMYSNRPVNKLRGTSFMNNLLGIQGRESRATISKLTKYVNGLPNDENKKIAQEALKSYKKMPYIWNTLRGPVNASNNAASEKAALEQIIAGKVGIRVGSCVSGKDREEMITQIAIAQQQYFLKNGAFPPPYDAKGPGNKVLRDEFETMVAQQYLTGHGHLLAAENSKGCDGLKNIEDVFGKNICNKIKALAKDYGIDDKFNPVKDVQKVAGFNKLSEKKLTDNLKDKNVVAFKAKVAQKANQEMQPKVSTNFDNKSPTTAPQQRPEMLPLKQSATLTNKTEPVTHSPEVAQAIQNCIKALTDISDKIPKNDPLNHKIILRYTIDHLKNTVDPLSTAESLLKSSNKALAREPSNPLQTLKDELTKIKEKNEKTKEKEVTSQKSLNL